MLRKFLVILVVLLIAIGSIKPATAQLPFIQDLAIYTRLLRQIQQNSLNSACIRLDGRCLFKLSATDADLLSDRIQEIQERFNQATGDYFADRNNTAEIAIRPNGNLQDLYLAIDNNTEEPSFERLFTVTNIDARANDVGVPVRARQLKFSIDIGLAVARQERSRQYLRKQIILGLSIFSLMFVVSFPLNKTVGKLRKSVKSLFPNNKYCSTVIKLAIARHQANLTISYP